MEVVKIEEYKSELLKSYNFNRKKLYPLLKAMSEEEKLVVLSDDEVINRIKKMEDDDVLGLFFKMSPAQIQELIFEDEECQRRLLCVENINLQDTRALNKSIYFSKDRLRKIQIFIKEIKSLKILENIVNNVYFQAIVLFAKSIPSTILESINCTNLYNSTIASGIYDLASLINKRTWTTLMNYYAEEILLPEDFRKVYETSEGIKRSYYDLEANTIIPMLRSKSYHLAQINKALSIGKDTLECMTQNELMILYNLVSEKETSIFLDKNDLENYFKDMVGKAISGGYIFTTDFINLKNISKPYYFFIFQCVKEFAKENNELFQQLLEFLYTKLFHDEYSLEEKNMINSYLINCVLNCDGLELSKLFDNPSDLKSIFHMRFNKTAHSMNYLNGIKISQIMKLNVKQINKIVKLLEDKTQDEISDIYSKAIRMYLIFGLDRTVAILRGDYGNVSKAFLDCVSKLEVSDVELRQVGKKYEPLLNQEFINFLFTGNNICELLRSSSAFENTWFYLFNTFDEIKETCKGHITIKQVEIILKEKMKGVKFDVTPDLYPLEDYLYEIGLGNKTKYPNEVIYREVVKIYTQQLTRKTSSIPYVSGVIDNGYKYEVMKMDDALGYVLGYRAGCCIRTLDIAHNHLLHALLCENGRILLTYTPDGKLASFSPLKRNGELLIANSIEAIGDNKTNKDVALVFSEGIRAIMNETRLNEKEGYLKVTCIGRNSYLKPEGEPWPQYLPTPTILEKDDEVYSKTDIYHKKLDVIMLEEGFKLENLQFGKVDKQYTDPMKNIKSCKFTNEAVSLDKIEIGRVVNSIKYRNVSEESKKHFYRRSIYNMDFAFWNEDWYILIDKDGRFYSESVNGNADALKEMQATIAVIAEMTDKKEFEEYSLSLKNKEIN